MVNFHEHKPRRGVSHAPAALQFIPPADIALYATITGLACFSRPALRWRVLENPNLRPFLDLEPYLRDIARAFYDNKFKTGLELLDKYQVGAPSLKIGDRVVCTERADLILSFPLRRLVFASISTSVRTSTPSSPRSVNVLSSHTSALSLPSRSSACRTRSVGHPRSCRSPSSS